MGVKGFSSILTEDLLEMSLIVMGELAFSCAQGPFLGVAFGFAI